jgi:hypothetical protein
MFLLYELFLGLSRGEETFDFGKCYCISTMKRRTFHQPCAVWNGGSPPEWSILKKEADTPC